MSGTFVISSKTATRISFNAVLLQPYSSIFSSNRHIVGKRRGRCYSYRRLRSPKFFKIGMEDSAEATETSLSEESDEEEDLNYIPMKAVRKNRSKSLPFIRENGRGKITLFNNQQPRPSLKVRLNFTSFGPCKTNHFWSLFVFWLDKTQRNVYPMHCKESFSKSGP